MQNDNWTPENITKDDRGKLFDNFTLGVTRLEMRSVYSTPTEKPILDAFVQKRPVPNLIKGAEDWYDNMKTATDAGKYFTKIKLVPKTLTPYLQMQLELLAPISVAHGMDYRIVTHDKAESILKDLKICQDFWFFDRKTILLMDYDASGVCTGARILRAPSACLHAQDILNRLYAVSLPFAQFMRDVYSNF